MSSKPTPVVEPPSPPPAVTVKPQTLQDALETFVAVLPAPDGSHFTCVGKCTKCGWQTMQVDRDEAARLVRQHVQTHWRDVALLLKNNQDQAKAV